MNHSCHGEFFTDAGVRKYRCFADSSITAAAVSNGDQCPCCGRKIDGTEKPAFAWSETKWEEEHETLLIRHERGSFLDFADGRGAIKGAVDLEPYWDPVIEFAFQVNDDTPENHEAFLIALAEFIHNQPGIH